MTIGSIGLAQSDGMCWGELAIVISAGVVAGNSRTEMAQGLGAMAGRRTGSRYHEPGGAEEFGLLHHYRQEVLIAFASTRQKAFSE